MGFQRYTFLVMYTIVFCSVIFYGDCKPLFDSVSSYSSPDQIFQQAIDVATGKRDLKIKGNILEGNAKITTSYTNEEIMTMVAIAGGILLFLVCCGVCCKHVCCPSKSPTVIMYQQMPTAQPQVQRHSPVHSGVSNAMIPLRNHGFTEIRSSAPVNITPPPPYPGMSVQG